MTAPSDAVLPGSAFRAGWRRAAEARAGEIFLVEPGRAYTYAELDRHAGRLAAGLAALGIGPGDPVLLGMGNHAGFVVAHLAIQRLGAVTVPLIADAAFDDLAYPARHSAGRVLVADRRVWATLKSRRGELADLATVLLWQDDDPGEPGVVATAALDGLPPPSCAACGDDDLAPYAIVYTSGSSGRPKGVVVPAGAPFSVGLGLVDRLGLSAADTILVPTPMAHSVGLVTAIGGAILAGARLALAPRFSPARFWDDVAASGATLCCLFPAHMNLLLETEAAAPPRGRTGLRAIFTHAVNRAFIDRFGLPLHLCWGMTETGALMAMSGALWDEAEPGYVGTPMPDTRIAAFGDDGRELPPGTPGELRLKHRHVMLRYHRDAAATAETLVDGWVRSGDRGWIGAGGAVHYAGRIKSMIKRSGENISPEEVEAVFAALPGVAECLVFGVPDPIRTEEVVACIAPRAGATFAPAALSEAAAATLSRWKLPRFLVAWPGPLPRLANGKIDRRTIIASCDLAGAWDARKPAEPRPAPLARETR